MMKAGEETLFQVSNFEHSSIDKPSEMVNRINN